MANNKMTGSTTRRGWARRLFLTSSVLALLIGQGGRDAALADQLGLSIPAQPLGAALDEFIEKTGIQLFYTRKDVARFESRGVSGAVSAEQAIAELLNGTGLSYIFEEENLIVIRRAAEAAARDGRIRVNSNTHHFDNGDQLAQVSEARRQTRVTDAGGGAGLASLDEDYGEEAAIEEMIVTGSLIRGTEASVGTALMVIDRGDIELGGFGTIEDAIQSLPSVFKGGINEDAVSAVNDGNFGGGTSINLRGLGAGATLTLVNGRRLQEGGRQGGFVDISNIPTSAIERVEVLADGASATYGSDAIGGVVNVILRDDYEGAETSFRFGSVTEGGSQEYRASQTFGTAWGTGNVLISYEYFNRESLGREEKSFSASSDLTPFGGDDLRTDFSVPGNILDPATFQPAFAIPSGTDGILTSGDLLAGEVNLFNDNPGRNLLLDQERHSVLLVASQKLGERIELFAEGRFSNKDFKNRAGSAGRTLVVPATNPFFVDPFGGSAVVRVRYNTLADFGPEISQGDVTDYNSVFGFKADIGRDWQAQIYGSYGRRDGDTTSTTIDTSSLNDALADDDPTTAFNPFGDGNDNNPQTLEAIRSLSEFELESDIWSVNTIADGPLFRIPAGDVKLAVGAEYYETKFSSLSITFDTERDFNRSVAALFGEILVPLIGGQNSLPGIERLTISASGRFEDYDDVGSAANPKVGVLWSPIGGLDFRGTYGTSFRAPNLADLDESGDANGSFIFPLSDSASATGTTLGLVLFGNNADLNNETARTWTVGFDYAPPALPGLSFDLTYYNIRFDDRVTSALDGAGLSILNQEDRFGSVIVRDPDQELIDEICDDDSFQGDPALCGVLPIGAIVDFRLSNTAVTKTDGLDFNVQYGLETANLGRFDFRLSGSYILSFDEAFSPGAPIVELIDTIANPIDFTMRNSVRWNNDSGLSATVFLNYSDSYTDNVSTPERKINSWTTIDLTLAYNTVGRLSDLRLNDIRLSLSIRNLFDNDPPFVNNSAVRVGYDPENVSPLGRFISFNITKTW